MRCARAGNLYIFRVTVEDEGMHSLSAFASIATPLFMRVSVSIGGAK